MGRSMQAPFSARRCNVATVTACKTATGTAAAASYCRMDMAYLATLCNTLPLSAWHSPAVGQCSAAISRPVKGGKSPAATETASTSF